MQRAGDERTTLGHVFEPLGERRVDRRVEQRHEVVDVCGYVGRVVGVGEYRANCLVDAQWGR